MHRGLTTALLVGATLTACAAKNNLLTETETEAATSEQSSTSDEATATSAGASTSAGTTTLGSTGDGSVGACGPSPCLNVVVMGYWPPTNEMLRPWSTNPEQNPGGWQGENWRGLGFNIYAFFPEFPPDGDPSDDDIGSPGSVGSPDFDLRVDYQATSADFWRIVDEHHPIVLVTTSRGGEIGWEIEALEGGHTNPMDQGADPSLDWISDGYGAETRPTLETIDARSWAAISTYRQGTTLATHLPAAALLEALSALNIVDVEIDATGTSGRYLSGFLGLHGLYYSTLQPNDTTAGHIHVGQSVTAQDATAMIEETMALILEAFNERRGRPLSTP
jgi:hypothetical protein